MDFINKRFNGVFIISLAVVLFLAAGYLVINLLPVILVAVAAIWGINAIRKWINNRKKSSNNVEYMKTETSPKQDFDFSDGPIIDVDYTEVKGE
ncbi:MAG: hypothetical protein Q8936_03365 [Bacillota bacterium]|nr:hypothetical protein [Bacillota bacterium]